MSAVPTWYPRRSRSFPPCLYSVRQYQYNFHFLSLFVSICYWSRTKRTEIYLALWFRNLSSEGVSFLAGSLLNLEWDRLSIFWKIRHDFLKSSSCWVVWVRRNLKDHWVPSLAVVVRVIFHQTRFLNAPSNLALNKGHASLIKHVEILGF